MTLRIITADEHLAEAKAKTTAGVRPRDRLRAGESWWLDSHELTELAGREQDDRYQGNAWEDPIRHYPEFDVHWETDSFGARRAYSIARSAPLNDTTIGDILGQSGTTLGPAGSGEKPK